MNNTKNSFGHSIKNNVLTCNFIIDGDEAKEIGTIINNIETKITFNKSAPSSNEIKEIFKNVVNQLKIQGSTPNSQIEEETGIASLFFKATSSLEVDSLLSFQIELPDNASQIPPEIVEKAFHRVLDSFLSLEIPVTGYAE